MVFFLAENHHLCKEPQYRSLSGVWSYVTVRKFCPDRRDVACCCLEVKWVADKSRFITKHLLRMLPTQCAGQGQMSPGLHLIFKQTQSLIKN
jgi:hypothetical protein